MGSLEVGLEVPKENAGQTLNLDNYKSFEAVSKQYKIYLEAQDITYTNKQRVIAVIAEVKDGKEITLASRLYDAEGLISDRLQNSGTPHITCIISNSLRQSQKAKAQWKKKRKK